MLMLRRLAVSVSCLVACSQYALAQEAPELRGQVREMVASFQRDHDVPGITVAYVIGDAGVESVAVGEADVEAGIPMAPHSRMLAASIGKTIWGALVLALESEGKLQQSDPVSDYLGSLDWFSRVPNAATMTVGQLLTHSAGVPDHVHMEGAAGVLAALGEAENFDPAQMIGLVLDEAPLFEAGAGWSYSDTGYLLLGLVIEAASGQSVYELAQTRLLTPLGLTETSASDTPRLAGLAVGYTSADNPFGLPPRTTNPEGVLLWNPVIEWTGGGFVSTSADLARWGHALYSGAAFEGAYMDRLLASVPVDPDAPEVRYGSGTAIFQDTPFGMVLGHGGWVPGYVSSLRHYADHDVTVAFQINSDAWQKEGEADLVAALEAALAEFLIRQAQTAQ